MSKPKYNKYGININTFNLLFNEEEHFKQECSKEIMAIEKYFEHQLDEDRLPLQTINYHIRKNFFTNDFTYKDENNRFRFDKLEKHIDGIFCDNPYISEKLLLDIKLNLIKGNCYGVSIAIASNIKNSNLVTSFIPFEDGTKHLHSYVEYNGYILDYTKNLVMKKKYYDRLLQVEEIGKINSKEINDIYNLMVENRVLNTTRYIAIFGKEIVKDLEKNKQLLRKPLNKKADYNLIF